VRIRRRKGFCPWGHVFIGDAIHRGCGPCRRNEPRIGRYDSLRERLRNIGVLGRKHIPAVYLRADADQRMALLQGLIDSDGSVEPGKGRASFTNTNLTLIEGVEELLTTLGFKSDRKSTETGAWRVYFNPDRRDPVARLPHKVAAHRVIGDNPRSRRRHVVLVEPVASVPVRCIGIDTADHLFLVGRRAVPTHNTGNVYATIHYNLTTDQDDPPLSYVPGVDVGLERVLLPGGGEIRVSTASSSAKDGGKESFCVLDAGAP
jgi:hypothetical protein